MKPSRIHSVDILRGLLAVGVMLYHYSYWLQLALPQPLLSLSHKVGIYAVEGFFVLSGFSLYWAYRDRPPTDARSYLSFLAARSLRLAPLFAAAILLNSDISLSQVPLAKLLSNITLTFGLFDASASLLVGGWSIGVEMALSLAFPLLLILQERMRRWFLLVIVAACVPMYFWQGAASYVQAPNHLAFFAAGIYFGYLRTSGFNLSPVAFWAVLIATLSFFVGYQPNISGWADLVEGLNRAVFFCLTLVFTGLFCFYEFKEVRFVFPSLTLLGEASYSVYLLHPLVYQRWPVNEMPALASFFILPILTITLAGIAYHLFEKPILRLKPKTRRPVEV